MNKILCKLESFIKCPWRDHFSIKPYTIEPSLGKYYWYEIDGTVFLLNFKKLYPEKPLIHALLLPIKGLNGMAFSDNNLNVIQKLFVSLNFNERYSFFRHEYVEDQLYSLRISNRSRGLFHFKVKNNKLTFLSSFELLELDEWNPFLNALDFGERTMVLSYILDGIYYRVGFDMWYLRLGAGFTASGKEIIRRDVFVYKLQWTEVTEFDFGWSLSKLNFSGGAYFFDHTNPGTYTPLSFGSRYNYYFEFGIFSPLDAQPTAEITEKRVEALHKELNMVRFKKKELLFYKLKFADVEKMLFLGLYSFEFDISFKNESVLVFLVFHKKEGNESSDFWYKTVYLDLTKDSWVIKDVYKIKEAYKLYECFFVLRKRVLGGVIDFVPDISKDFELRDKFELPLNSFEQTYDLKTFYSWNAFFHKDFINFFTGTIVIKNRNLVVSKQDTIENTILTQKSSSNGKFIFYFLFVTGVVFSICLIITLSIKKKNKKTKRFRK